MKQVWRFIPCIETNGSLQMAIDRWLLTQHQQSVHPPTLRFYTWSPAAISLGFHQKQWPDSWLSLHYQGQPVDLVQRPSGGRAVLHQGDLTYAVITSGLNGNRVQVYQQLCEFLIAGWQSLGIHLSYGSYQRGYQHNVNCFSLATGADLVMDDGTKLIGSAQLYRQGAVLQHGSMMLNPDPELYAQVFGQSFGASPTWAREPCEGDQPLAPALQRPSQDRIIAALTTAAETCFGIELQTQPISASEWELIRQTLPCP